MEVKIKKTRPDAVIPYKTHSSDFCYDCVAISEEEIAPNVWKYGLGLAFQIKRDMTKPFCGMMITTKPEGEEITGKHIFSMKVPTFDMQQYDEMIRLTEQAGVVCQVELEMRHHAPVYRVKEAIQNGAIGKLLSSNGSVVT